MFSCWFVHGGLISGDSNYAIFQVEKASENTLLKRPMFIHSLDISTVPHGYVTWRAPNLTDVYGEVAGETQYYSLTEGSYIR